MDILPVNVLVQVGFHLFQSGLEGRKRWTRIRWQLVVRRDFTEFRQRLTSRLVLSFHLLDWVAHQSKAGHRFLDVLLVHVWIQICRLAFRIWRLRMVDLRPARI